MPINHMLSMASMHKDDLSKLSLQSLRLLVLVHEERSLTGASARLDINQSSVSYMIDRLRHVFGDPLFVRVGRGIMPTPRCSDIVARLREILNGIERLAEGTHFDPATAALELTLACNYHERVVVLPALLRRLRKDAPHIRLNVIQASTYAARYLHEGICDIAISPEGTGTQGIHTKRLFAERYTLFVDPAHPFAAKAPTMADYLAAQHLTVRYAEGWQPYYRMHPALKGQNLHEVVEVPSLGGVERLVAGTDLVLTAPDMMRASFLPDLVAVEPPFTVAFDVHLLWGERTDLSAPQAWLRDAICSVVSELEN